MRRTSLHHSPGIRGGLSDEGHGLRRRTSGMEASRDSLTDLGTGGVKLVSQVRQYFGWPSAQILGGAQFNTSVANYTAMEGGSAEFPNPSVERGLFNVLQAFFIGTAAAGAYCEADGTVPLNYLQVYYPDIQHADENGATSVIQGLCGTVISTSAQTESTRQVWSSRALPIRCGVRRVFGRRASKMCASSWHSSSFGLTLNRSDERHADTD
jgi:hypothetical protein